MTEAVVVDVSALIDVLLSQASRPAVELLATAELHAPYLLDYEVASALRRLTQAGALSESSAQEALESLRALEIERHPAEPMLARMWGLRHSVTPYDAAYVTLAEALGVPLLTVDHRLAAVAKKYCRVVG